MTNESAAQPPLTWWRVPMVWLVIGGPAVVVVASFVTLALAILNPDPVLQVDRATSASELPAVQGRNHAATAGP
jgi:uncharacterized protein